MRKMVTYIAYDGEEFDDREACLAYEANILDLLKEIDNAYSFFDKDMNVFIMPTNSDIDSLFNWFSTVCDICVFIHREKNLSDAANDLVDTCFGYCVKNEDFNWNVGWFQWSKEDVEWIKVDE